MTPITAPRLMILPLAAIMRGENALTIARIDPKLVSKSFLASVKSV